jgi:hypothetical protein
MGTKPDWNHYRKLINAMKKNGFTQQAESVAALVRLGSAVEQEDYPKAQHVLYNDVPQRMVRVDGNQ